MALRLLVAMTLAVGCFNPNVKNGGYTCAPTDDPACPNGFVCVHGRCLDTAYVVDASVVGGDDLAMSGGGGDLAQLSARDLGHRGGAKDFAVAGDFAVASDFAAGNDDLAVAPHDLAHAPHDLAHAPPDLKKGPDMATGECAHAGTPCTQDSQCCSNTCSVPQGSICIGG